MINPNIRLNPNPPQPNPDHLGSWLEGTDSVIKNQTEQWVEAHHPFYQPALRNFANAVRRINHPTFLNHLEVVVQSFNKSMQDVEDKRYVVLVQQGKSNQWVAELALKHLKHEPTEALSLGEKQATDYLRYLQTTDKIDQTIKTIVLFDDASYSGTQLSEHVKAIFSQFIRLRASKQVVIHVVAPFATGYAYDKLKNLPQFGEGRLKLHIAMRIKSVAEALSSEDVARLTDLFGWSNDPGESRGRGIIYFDHKIPNGMSFIDAFAYGCVSPGTRDHALERPHTQKYKNLPPITPPYKN